MSQRDINLVEAIIFTLDDRVTLTDHLFPTTEYADNYREEWLCRNVMAYWCHLDPGNRQRLINFACEGYNVSV